MKIIVDLDMPAYRVGSGARSNAATIRRHAAIYETFFEAVVRCNCEYLRTHPKAPLLYASGVRWREEGSPEKWKDIPSILRDGYDDCEGVACWLAAEMRVRPRNSVENRAVPGARVILRTTSTPGLWHAIVEDIETGKRYDPSVRLGMRGRDG